MKSNEDRHLPLQTETIQAYVVDAIGNDKEVFLQMVDLFLDSADNLHKEIVDGLATKDFSAARRSAHSLKSSSLMFSAESLSALCAEAEALAEKRQDAAIALLLPRIRVELDWLRLELPPFCAKMLQ